MDDLEQEVLRLLDDAEFMRQCWRRLDEKFKSKPKKENCHEDR